MIGVFVAWRNKSISNTEIKSLDDGGLTAFVGRKRELGLLLKAWRSHTQNVFILHGEGGIGKTSLVQTWLTQTEAFGWLEAEQVFGWSFPDVTRYQDAQQAMQAFLQQALAWFGPDMKIPDSRVEQLTLLARLIQRRRTLLVLDNVSHLHFTPETSQSIHERQLLGALLNQLAAYNPGLCLLTGRKAVPVCRAFQPGVFQHELACLDDEAGAHLLKQQGVQAEINRLRRIARNFGGHPLSLSLLGSYLKQAYSGSAERLDSIPVWQDMEKEGFHVRRVLGAIEQWMGTSPDLILICLLSLLDGPATKKELFMLLGNWRQPWFRRWIKPDEALNSVAPLTKIDLHEYTKIQHRLYRLHLISSPSVAATLDTHPLIRAFFRQRVALRFPVMQERFPKLLENCRQNPEPVIVPESEMGGMVRSHALPDVPTAVRSTRALGYKLEQSANRKQWYRASIIAYHLSEHHLVLGNIPAAVYCARRSVAYAELSHDRSSMAQNLQMLTKLLRLTGGKAEALTLLQRARQNFDTSRILSKPL